MTSIENFLFAAKKVTPLIIALINRWTVSLDSRMNFRVVTTSLFNASTPKSIMFNRTLNPIFLRNHHLLERKRGPIRDPVGQSRHSHRRGADLNNRHVFLRNQSNFLENLPKDEIRRGAESADREFFPLQLLGL